MDNSVWAIQSEKKVFIGTLDPDDFDSFKVTARINPQTAPGTYPVVLRFEYKNQDYESKSQEKTVELAVYRQDQANTAQQGSIWDWLLPLVVLGIIAYFAYQRFFKKPKK